MDKRKLPKTKKWKEMMSKVQKGRTHFPWQGFQKKHPQFNTGRTHWKKGQKPMHWKGGRIKDGYGYIKIYKPYHPFCDSHGYVKEARLVMEKSLNRYLSKKEVIHHINEIKDDNRIENLTVFINNSEHMKNCHLFKENPGFKKGHIPWNKGKKCFYMKGNQFAKKHKNMLTYNESRGEPSSQKQLRKKPSNLQGCFQKSYDLHC